MKRIVFLLSLILTALHCAFAEEQQTVLIIGNSYTYCNDLPNMLQAISSKSKCPLKVESYTAGAMSLQGFLDDPRHTKARQLVETGNYDWLILQDQSQTPAYKPEETLNSVRRWKAIADRRGTKVLLFLTWAHASADGGKMKPLLSMQELTSATYCKAGAEHNIKVAPVGEAWTRWYKKNPGKPLHVSDRSHPNANGTYLAACVIHATLSEKPAKAPATLKIDNRTIARIPKATAKELQSIANATVKDFTPQKYLAEREKQDSKLPDAATVKKALHPGMHIDELTEITGKPLLHSAHDKRHTYQFRIRGKAELVAYCTETNTIESISIASPGEMVEIIDLNKL